MNNTESTRLLNIYFSDKSRWSPRINIVSRRSAKNKRTATGQTHLKSFRVTSDVPIEKVFRSERK